MKPFVFSDEQRELRQAVRGFVEAVSPEPEVRRLMETSEGYDPAVWARIATELDLVGLAVPAEYGGSGAGCVEVAVVCEEMGRRLLCAPYLSTAVLAVAALVRSGDTAARKTWLPPIAAGELTATLAFAEEPGRWDASGVTASAVPTADGWRLTGTKSYVLDGHTAGLLLVAARTGAGISLFAVTGDASGLTRTRLKCLDLTRRLASSSRTPPVSSSARTAPAGW
jgi:alkylation response protein AidB-like acyl-CoA dehydrogenase